MGIIAQRESLVVGIVCLVAIVVLALLHRPRALPIVTFAALGVAMGFISEHHNEIPYNQNMELVARVETAPTISGRWQRTVSQVMGYKDSTGVWRAVDQRVQTYIDTASTIASGSTITLQTKQLAIDSTYQKHYLNRGITGRVFGYRARTISTDTTLLERVTIASAKLSSKIARIDTSPQNIALIQALTLGDKSGISRDQRNENVRAGTAHILAVSGLHVGIIFMMLSALLGWIKLLRRGLLIYCVAVILILWIYAAVTGFSPSVLRAVVMFSLYQIGTIISRNSNNLNTLYAAGLILLLCNPNYLYDIGFQLSFVAMLGIAVFYQPIYGLWRNRLWSLVAISIAAQIAVLPLACYYFGNIPLFGIFTNLGLWAVVPAIILSAFLYLIFSAVFLGDISAFCANIYNQFVSWSSAHEWIAVQDINMPQWLCLSIYAIMILGIRISSRLRPKYPTA